MDIRVKATDFEITREVSQYLQERLATLEKLLGERSSLARCEVELGRDAGNQRHGAHMWFAEITIKGPGMETARATNRAETINAAIDDVKEEVERQLRQQKKLHRRLLKRGGALAKRLLRLGD